MKKALFLSLLLHFLSFSLCFFLLPRQHGQEKRDALSVGLIGIGAGSVLLQEEIAEKDNPLVMGRSSKPAVQPEFDENVPDGTDTEEKNSDKIEFQDDPGVEIATGRDEMTANDNIGFDPVENIIIENINERNPAETPEAVGEAAVPLDIRWPGGEGRALIQGDSPHLLIPGNSALIDRIEIAFSVYPDGRVANVRIAPPGSSSLQVDRQLREWASLLVFESSSSDKTVEGILRIRLHTREFP